jgi:hypothetical protein
MDITVEQLRVKNIDPLIAYILMNPSNQINGQLLECKREASEMMILGGLDLGNRVSYVLGLTGEYCALSLKNEDMRPEVIYGQGVRAALLNDHVGWYLPGKPEHGITDEKFKLRNLEWLNHNYLAGVKRGKELKAAMEADDRIYKKLFKNA